eukprot:3099344-Amphidinium_carterae.1
MSVATPESAEQVAADLAAAESYVSASCNDSCKAMLQEHTMLTENIVAIACHMGKTNCDMLFKGIQNVMSSWQRCSANCKSENKIGRPSAQNLRRRSHNASRIRQLVLGRTL